LGGVVRRGAVLVSVMVEVGGAMMNRRRVRRIRLIDKD
jgi:hypothetical protein